MLSDLAADQKPLGGSHQVIDRKIDKTKASLALSPAAAKVNGAGPRLFDFELQYDVVLGASRFEVGGDLGKEAKVENVAQIFF